MAYGNAQGLALAEGRKTIKDRTPTLKGGKEVEGKDAKKVDTEVNAAEAGASKTYPLPAGQLKKGGFVVMKKKFPCKIENLSTSKTGKHGHAKINMSAKDIFTGKKYEDICPSTHNVECPFVKRQEYNFTGEIDESGYVSLMNEHGEIVNNLLKVNEESATEIRAQYKAAEENKKVLAITVISAMGMNGVGAFKQNTLE
jgi:translation initiation factor 5A